MTIRGRTSCGRRPRRWRARLSSPSRSRRRPRRPSSSRSATLSFTTLSFDASPPGVRVRAAQHTGYRRRQARVAAASAVTRRPSSSASGVVGGMPARSGQRSKPRTHTAMSAITYTPGRRRCRPLIAAAPKIRRDQIAVRDQPIARQHTELAVARPLLTGAPRCGHARWRHRDGGDGGGLVGAGDQLVAAVPAIELQAGSGCRAAAGCPARSAAPRRAFHLGALSAFTKNNDGPPGWRSWKLRRDERERDGAV